MEQWTTVVLGIRGFEGAPPQLRSGTGIAGDNYGSRGPRSSLLSQGGSPVDNGIDLISNNFTGFLHTDAAAFAGSIVPVFASASIG